MALRFRRRIKLAPGLYWNLSGGGSSFSFGPRGASVSVGRRGTHFNMGLPGTGLYARERIAGSGSQPSPRAAARRPTTSVSLTCRVDDDGTIYFLDPHGQPASEQLIALAKKQNRDAILELIQRQCDEINDEVEELGRLHHGTPDCRAGPRFVPIPFDRPEPRRPADVEPTFFQRFLKSRREKIQRKNAAALSAYRIAVQDWEQARAEHQRVQDQRQRLIDIEILSDEDAMERFLEERLQEIVWPRETSVDLEVTDGGQKVMLDVDLPELEHMPSKVASVPSRGLKLTVKEMTPGKVRKLYLEHVHAIVFRLVGEAFATLPTTQTVVVSGYSQRTDPATGQVRDDYLISFRVTRERWQEIDFGRLAELDVVEALERLEVRRNAQRSGKLLTIEPFSS